MTWRALAGRAAVLLVGGVLAGCGDPPAELERHGLETEPLPSAPPGEVVETYTHLCPGVWTGTVRKHWTVSRDGGAPLSGSAVLRLEVVREADGEGWSTGLRIELEGAEGLGTAYSRPFDGLEATVRHDPLGRPDPATVALVSTTPGAVSALRGFWLAGLGGGTPWFPAGRLSEGEAWARSRLGEAAWLLGATGRAGALPRLDGGARLEEVRRDDGDVLLFVRLDGLVEEELVDPGEAVSMGLRDRGTALFQACDGLPRTWTLRQDVRVRHRTGTRRSALDMTMEVEGELSPAPEDGR